MGEKGIEIPCDVDGREDGKVVFKRAGWKFKHLRIWQQALMENTLTVSELSELVSERIESWSLKDDDGQAVAFSPGPRALDELPNKVASFVVNAFKRAYYESQAPDPNA